ncbi:MAG: hypothetical protein JW896_02505 [Deltaproteobacteria bacterium]|nr:hypothetical protein [Deltaproteobacteria bacterium]
MKPVLGNSLAGKNIRYLLCDTWGKTEPELEGGEWVQSPIQCLDRAVETKPNIIVVRFWQMPIREREALVDLCTTLKWNSYTRKIPVLALLHAKHRGLIEDLQHADVDFARFFSERSLNSGRMIEIIGSLGAKDRVERQLKMLCPYLHYDAIDAKCEMILCGAYKDRMVLGGKWLHKMCETGEHLHCEYYLKPRVKS